MYYRPRLFVDTAEPTPPSSSEPLHTLAENLKAALPVVPSVSSRDIVIGSLGILHPSVLSNFGLSKPCSTVEIDVEPLL